MIKRTSVGCFVSFPPHRSAPSFNPPATSSSLTRARAEGSSTRTWQHRWDRWEWWPFQQGGMKTGWWLNQPIRKICSSNWIISPMIGVRIKYIWNHHLEDHSKVSCFNYSIGWAALSRQEHTFVHESYFPVCTSFFTFIITSTHSMIYAFTVDICGPSFQDVELWSIKQLVFAPLLMSSSSTPFLFFTQKKQATNSFTGASHQTAPTERSVLWIHANSSLLQRSNKRLSCRFTISQLISKLETPKICKNHVRFIVDQNRGTQRFCRIDFETSLVAPWHLLQNKWGTTSFGVGGMEPLFATFVPPVSSLRVEASFGGVKSMPSMCSTLKTVILLHLELFPSVFSLWTLDCPMSTS